VAYGFAMTLCKRTKSEPEEHIYNAFSRHYDLLQGELSKATWAQGIGHEIRASSRKEGRMFDAGAGTGTGARFLKTIGNFHVTSCDRSQPMLRHAKDISDEILHADLAAIPPLSVKFDFIVSGNDALNYLRSEELGQFFQWSRQHLTARGLLIFDYSSPKLLRECWKSREWEDTIGELRLAWKTCYDELLQRSKIELTCRSKRVILWTETHYQYSLQRFDIEVLAQANQLEIQCVRNLRDSDFSLESHTHVFVLTHRKSENYNATISGKPSGRKGG
jgi:SAM-dependent methyltransferase